MCCACAILRLDWAAVGEERRELRRELERLPWLDVTSLPGSGDFNISVLQEAPDAENEMLLYAVQHNGFNAEALEFVLDQYPQNISAIQDKKGRDLLFYAAAGGDGEVVDVLLRKGLVLKKDKSNLTALDYAHDAVMNKLLMKQMGNTDLVNDRPDGPSFIKATEVYADSLVEFARHASPPLTVGLYAAWGSGKSFLMNKIIERLDPNKIQDKQERKKANEELRAQGNENIPTVVFNAWVYNRSDVLWVALVKELYEAVEREVGATTVRKAFLWRYIKQRYCLLICYLLLLLGLVALALLSTFHAGTRQLVSIVGASVAGAVALPLVLWVVRMLWQSEGHALLSRVRNNPTLANSVDFMESVRDNITFLTSVMKAHGMRLALFVDDLDRCSPDKVVSILSALLLLLSDNKLDVIIFLCIDERVVVKQIESSFATLATAGITGYEYLDKIVQLPFAIPQLSSSQKRGYVEKALEVGLGGTASSEAFSSLARRASVLSKSRSQSSGTAPKMEYKATKSSSTQSLEVVTELVRTSAPTEDAPPLQAKRYKTLQRREVDALPGRKGVRLSPEQLLMYRDYSALMQSNARGMKRILNVHQVAIRAFSGLFEEPITAQVARWVGLWVIVCERWPTRVTMMLLHMRAKLLEGKADIFLRDDGGFVGLHLDDYTGQRKLISPRPVPDQPNPQKKAATAPSHADDDEEMKGAATESEENEKKLVQEVQAPEVAEAVEAGWGDTPLFKFFKDVVAYVTEHGSMNQLTKYLDTDDLEPEFNLALKVLSKEGCTAKRLSQLAAISFNLQRGLADSVARAMGYTKALRDDTTISVE